MERDGERYGERWRDGERFREGERWGEMRRGIERDVERD